MRILFCCQYYAPSVGGVQEVMRQLAERLVVLGHSVVVVTSWLPGREQMDTAGVEIKGFRIEGNSVDGMYGEVEAYQQYLLKEEYDLLLVYAAQQWSFDALWPILKDIEAKRVFVPCGFSNLYEKRYSDYYKNIIEKLRDIDLLIFNSNEYRDINFARSNGIANSIVIPNGADDILSTLERDATFRSRHGIEESSFLFLSVGSITGLKGHAELLRAFQLMKLPEGESATLLLNGNRISRHYSSVGGLFSKAIRLIRTKGIRYILGKISSELLGKQSQIDQLISEIGRTQKAKRVILVNLVRSELNQAFKNADLFVFASNIEYSPLVLFEAVAAGSPFLTGDVGNANEIAEWTQCGFMCKTEIDQLGYSHVEVPILAQEMSNLMGRKAELREMGKRGALICKEKFVWSAIAREYEQAFVDLCRSEIRKVSP
jgi:glycosyltransferase involved in cell wall biosynthesis